MSPENKTETTKWLGYDFLVYPLTTDWNKVSGLYVFAGIRPGPKGIPQWHPLYIGKAQDFSDRFPNHEKWAAAVLLGATRIHARVEEDERQREELEKKLIQHYQPPLNVEYVDSDS